MLYTQVVANQVILGPVVITLVFAWNKLWEGRLEQLPELYRTRALQTLLDGTPGQVRTCDEDCCVHDYALLQRLVA